MAKKRSYRELTVRDLVELVKHEDVFPLGLDTKILSGDFEGNALHVKHEMGADHDADGWTALLLKYEMHEG